MDSIFFSKLDSLRDFPNVHNLEMGNLTGKIHKQVIFLTYYYVFLYYYLSLFTIAFLSGVISSSVLGEFQKKKKK